MSKQPLNTKDLFKRLPFLAKNMKETEKKLIENYMSEKVRFLLEMFCYCSLLYVVHVRSRSRVC